MHIFILVILLQVPKSLQLWLPVENQKMITSWFSSWKRVNEYQLIYQLKTIRWFPVDLPVENQYDYQLIYQMITSWFTSSMYLMHIHD